MIAEEAELEKEASVDESVQSEEDLNQEVEEKLGESITLLDEEELEKESQNPTELSIEE